MMAPKVKVVTRFVKSDGWKDGFLVHCIKYGPDKYSSMCGLDKTFKEEVVYEGECPANLRVLPFVPSRYLNHYSTFYSQIVPRTIDERVARAIRGTCPISLTGSHIHMFDYECYHPSGKIIGISPMAEHADNIKEYLTQLLKKEDWNRIERFDNLGLENWGRELYSKETV